MTFLKDMKGLAKDATYYGVGSALAGLVSVILAPILTRVFVPEDYGIIVLVQLAVSFFVVIAGMNISSGMSYYYYKYDDEAERKKVLSSGLLMISVFSLLVSAGLYFGASFVAQMLEVRKDGGVSGHDLSVYLRIASVGLFFSLMMTYAQSVLRLQRKPQKFLGVQVASLLFQVFGVVALVVVLKYGISGVFWARAIAPMAGLVLGMYFVRRDIAGKVSWALLGLILAYALPQFPGVLVNWAQTQLGRVLLNYYVSLEELGLYSVAFTVSSIFMLFTSAFRMAYDPYSLSIMKQDNAKTYYAQIYDLYVAVFCVLLAGMAAFSKFILMFLTPETYHSAHSFIIYFLVAGFYMGANNIVATGIWISKKTSFSSYAQIISFVVLFVASITLINMWGAVGAAVAYLLATITQSIAYYIFAQKFWPIPFRYWRAHGLVAIVFIMGLLHNQIVDSLGLWQSGIAAMITSLVCVTLIWFLGVSQEHKDRAILEVLTILKKENM